MDQLPDGPDIGRGRDEQFWREFLTQGSSREQSLRRFLKVMPADSRCTLCAAPFSGVGGSVMRLMGKRRSERNPKVCSSCFDFMSANRGGAEISLTLLFADIRGSTSIAESISPLEFRQLLARFYDVAAEAVFEHDGMVDKFVGDELVATFFPLLTGQKPPVNAIGAAKDLLKATGHSSVDGPWVPVGAGVHTGVAWVGTVGTGARVELTAVGDAVNVAARLAANAAPGEILVSRVAADSAGLDPSLPASVVELKGKSEPLEVVHLNLP